MILFFFFSSRRRHTRWNCDWSSDVCSSDLEGGVQFERLHLLLDGPVVIAAVVERDGEDVTDDRRGRIERASALGLRSPLRESSLGRTNLRKPLVRRRVS